MLPSQAPVWSAPPGEGAPVRLVLKRPPRYGLYRLSARYWQSIWDASLFCIVNSQSSTFNKPKSSNYNPSVHGRRVAFVHFSGGVSIGILFLDTIFTLFFSEHFPGVLYTDYKKYLPPWWTSCFVFLYNTEPHLIKLFWHWLSEKKSAKLRRKQISVKDLN